MRMVRQICLLEMSWRGLHGNPGSEITLTAKSLSHEGFPELNLESYYHLVLYVSYCYRNNTHMVLEFCR